MVWPRLSVAGLVLGGALLSHVAVAEDFGPPPPFTPSYDDWGEIGLLQTPTARPGPDGDFAFTYSHIHPYDHYNFFFTPLPWLEAGFRYNIVNNRPYGPESPNEPYTAKGVDLRVRLVQESASFPETSIGLRDFAGAGIFPGEYLVFTRRYYNFDITGGFGWGYLANRAAFPNPLGLIAHSFKVRPPALSTTAGAISFDYFHGPNVGIFGGVEYHTPIEGLHLKVELDPNNYKNEPLGNSFRDPSPINASVSYQPYSFMDASVGIERGTTLMLRVTLKTNFNSVGLFRDSTKPPTLVPRPEPEPAVGIPLDQSTLPRTDATANPDMPSERPAALFDLPSGAGTEPTPPSGVDALYQGARKLGYDIVDVAIDGDTATLTVAPIAGGATAASGELARLGTSSLDVTHAIVTDVGSRAEAGLKDAPTPTEVEQQVSARIFADLKKIGFTGESFAMAGNHAWLSVSQHKYHIFTIALGRAARIVAADLPPEYELITIDMLEDNLTALSATVYRHDLERAVVNLGSPEEIWSHTTLAGADPARPPGIANTGAYPWYDWGLNPRTREYIGGPNNGFIYQLYAELSGTAHVAPGLSLAGSIGVNIANDLNDLTPTPASSLPHVRSDIGFYLKEGKSGIYDSQADYLFNIAPDWYGRVSGGLLEYMYGGVDGEILYRPYGQRLAIGLDVNHVYQRGFDDLFTFLPYQITEGQLSFYYKLPFYNLTSTLRIGRYLAGDKGATIEISRVFEGGVRVGVFATKTNVSSQQFGEGSFDKGILFSFPLDLLLANPSRSEASYVYRPLTRDGGQYVDIAKPLYGETDGYDPQQLSNMWPQLLH
jgi:hypothetical protein